jgi:predicted N-acetyltransferase YhbS
MPGMIAGQAEDRQIERQRRIMGDVERQHVAAILGHLLFERARQAGRRRGFLALDLGSVAGSPDAEGRRVGLAEV